MLLKNYNYKVLENIVVAVSSMVSLGFFAKLTNKNAEIQMQLFKENLSAKEQKDMQENPAKMAEAVEEWKSYVKTNALV